LIKAEENRSKSDLLWEILSIYVQTGCKLEFVEEFELNEEERKGLFDSGELAILGHMELNALKNEEDENKRIKLVMETNDKVFETKDIDEEKKITHNNFY